MFDSFLNDIHRLFDNFVFQCCVLLALLIGIPYLIKAIFNKLKRITKS